MTSPSSSTDSVFAKLGEDARLVAHDGEEPEAFVETVGDTAPLRGLHFALRAPPVRRCHLRFLLSEAPTNESKRWFPSRDADI
mmetsp:Transcript_72223/g.209080  ORF Transcript_72223/g.209080 Transcript_72223/m.209080 type:complete len:83 (+) Transcript_72223:193-441(+)